MPERPGEYKKRQERAKRFSEELGLKTILKNALGYMSDAKLIAMMNHNESIRASRCKGEGPCYYPVKADDLEMMIKEILKWRRGMLTRHEIKKYFAS